MTPFDNIRCPKCFELRLFQTRVPRRTNGKMTSHAACLCGYKARLSIDERYWSTNTQTR